MYDYAADFIKAELQVGLTFSILQPMLEQPPSSRPSKIWCLRFHSAALFTGDFSQGTIGNATTEQRGKTSCCLLAAKPL
jgi:hypothetical protein